LRKVICCALAFVLVTATVVAGFSVQLIRNTSSVLASPQPTKNVTLTVIFNEFNKHQGIYLLDSAINKLRSNHPNLKINVKFIETIYPNARDQMLKAFANGTSVDVISVDQIWLGEFAQKGLLTDLTNYTKKWGRLSDWYQSNLDGMIYNKSVYGIWAWTDVRGLWYWKDLLNKAGVDPNSLMTWNGYIESARKLNTVLRPEGIGGVHLNGANYSPDVWYPYLWMLGGNIVKLKSGHPTKGTYWFPAYNGSEGVRAMSFIKAQVDAGIRAQKNVSFGQEFGQRNFSAMIEGSWMPSNIPKQKLSDVGFIPAFPTPDNKTKTTTLIGGWEFAIPKTSSHKDLAWELVQIMLEPGILTPWIAVQGYLPTQISIGEGPGPYADQLRKSIPFYDQMISMIPQGRARPSIAEYPSIAEDIRQALNAVYSGSKDPNQALQDAAAHSAKTLGW
jgi:multiple sugar transport system substrate-binding protein